VLLAGGGGLAQEPPKPSPLVQKELAAKNISYHEWLLFHGIRERNADYVTTALRAGVDPNKARNPIGDLPALMVAVSTPSASATIVSLLLKHGADVNRRFTPKAMGTVPTTGYSPLYQAARHSNAEAVEELLKSGADVRARAGNGATALHATFDVEIGRVLQRYGADLNAKNSAGQTPLANAKRVVVQYKREPKHATRQKAEAYSAWLSSQGALE
jgi:ankyrin repeat protein